MGVGVVDESRLIKKADVLRISSSIGESCRSEVEPLLCDTSSANHKYLADSHSLPVSFFSVLRQINNDHAILNKQNHSPRFD